MQFLFDLVNSGKLKLQQAAVALVGRDSNLNPRILKTTAGGELIIGGGGFSIPEHDYTSVGYLDTGKTNVGTIVYKKGGVGGNIVGTITITYAGGGVTVPNDKVTSVALT